MQVSTAPTHKLLIWTLFFSDNLSPSGWAPMPLDERGNEVAVHTVNLASTCAEYQEVAQRVRQTLPSQNIVSIARIQNSFSLPVLSTAKAKNEERQWRR